MRSVSRKSIIVLVAICLFIALSMAAVNVITAPRIAEQERLAKEKALNEVIPINEGFDQRELEGLPESVSEVWVDKGGNGVVAILSVKGYDSSKPMSVAVGFTPDGRICKMVVISATGETSGIGSKVTNKDFVAQFEGKDESLAGVDTITGATVSSSAVINAVRESFVAYGLVKEANG